MAPSARADTSNTSGEELDPAAVDRFVGAYLDRHAVPGVALAITKGDEVVYAAGYGHDSTGAPVTASTRMPIASLSKSFTALAVLQLVEKGKVDLDAPVVDYLPDFELADPRYTQITVRQLLNQTSGMADTTFPEKSLPQPDSLKEAVERLPTAELAAEPGTEFHYHNPNHHVAARIVEVISGEQFAAYLERHVFQPLGMDATSTVATTADLTRVPRGHIVAYGQALAVPHPRWFVRGAGGIVTTARELAQWLILHNNGGKAADGTRVVSAASIRDMHVPSGPDREYALGWDQDTPEDGGPTRISHSGTLLTYTAVQILIPESGYGIAVMDNAGMTLVESSALIDGLIALTQGRDPDLGTSAVLVADAILGILTAVTLALGAWAMVRSRRWVRRRVSRPIWRNALALFPHLVPVAVFISCPTLLGLLGGRDVTWTMLAYMSAALTLFLGMAALSGAGVVVTRGICLIGMPRRRQTEEP